MPQFNHLSLPLKIKGRAYLTGGGRESQETLNNRRDRAGHGRKLHNQAVSIIEMWRHKVEDRQREGLVTLPQAVPMLLQIDPNTDIDFIKSFGFEIVSEQDDGYVVIATEDINLDVFLNKLDRFIRNAPKSGSAAKVHYMYGDENLALRLQRILSDKLYQQWNNIQEDEVYTFDIGIECMGTMSFPDPVELEEGESEEHFRIRKERWSRKVSDFYQAADQLRMEREMELERIVRSYGGGIISIFEEADALTSLSDSFTTRVIINGRGIKDIATNFPFAFEVTEPEEVDMFTKNDDAEGDAPFTVNIVSPEDDAPRICVIDSGISEGHRLLAPAIESEVSMCFLPGETNVADQVSRGGHGTRVAGAVLYPIEVPKNGSFQAPFWLQNARVLDSHNRMPSSLFPPVLLKRIVNRYNGTTNTRIYNHSISGFFPCRLQHMTAWPAEIDNLSYDHDVLFIQAAGNIHQDHGGPFRYGIRQHLMFGREYPSYLLEDSCRIPSPAQSLQSLTVGSISHAYVNEADRWSLGELNWPSAFSATGLGIWDSIKPDVVEYGGNYVVDNGTPFQFTTPPEVCPELVRSSPPAWARDDVGTSYAAPKVAHIVGMIQRILPDEPTTLYRALVAQSARWPEWANSWLPSRQGNVIRHLGYGVPNLDRATTNSPYRITLISSGRNSIFSREAHVYEISIPESMRSLSEEHDILLEVTLSYVAKPRRTRKKLRGYLSTWLDWKTSNIGESPESFANRVLHDRNHLDRDDESSIKWTIGNRTNVGIDGVSRSAGTLQKDWAIIKSHELTRGFNIAVIGHQGWNKDPNIKAYYSLAVSFEAINRDLEIYDLIRTEIENTINTEVEAELMSE